MISHERIRAYNTQKASFKKELVENSYSVINHRCSRSPESSIITPSNHQQTKYHKPTISNTQAAEITAKINKETLMSNYMTNFLRKRRGNFDDDEYLTENDTGQCFEINHSLYHKGIPAKAVIWPCQNEQSQVVLDGKDSFNKQSIKLAGIKYSVVNNNNNFKSVNSNPHNFRRGRLHNETDHVMNFHHQPCSEVKQQDIFPTDNPEFVHPAFNTLRNCMNSDFGKLLRENIQKVKFMNAQQEDTQVFMKPITNNVIENTKNDKIEKYSRKNVDLSFENNMFNSFFNNAMNVNYPFNKNQNMNMMTNKNGEKSLKENELPRLNDIIFNRYFIMKILGSGSFGQVYRAFDIKENTSVAIKVIKAQHTDAFNQSEIEIKILSELHQDQFSSFFFVKKVHDFIWNTHQCIVFELLDYNLYEILQKTYGKGFRITDIREIGYRLLLSLCVLHSKNIIHCDLKPENIMIKEGVNGWLKVVDFGSSCKDGEQIYNYIQSRFYRAPEVILDINYSMGIDVWSLGCILAELSTSEALFTGQTEHDQLGKIIEYLGLPPPSMIDSSRKKSKFFAFNDKMEYVFIPENNRNYFGPNSKSLSNFLSSNRNFSELLNGLLFRGDCWLGIDNSLENFVFSMLNYDPRVRAKPHDLLNHPFLFTITSTHVPLSSGSLTEENPHSQNPYEMEFKTEKFINAINNSNFANSATKENYACISSKNNNNFYQNCFYNASKILGTNNYFHNYMTKQMNLLNQDLSLSNNGEYLDYDKDKFTLDIPYNSNGNINCIPDKLDYSEINACEQKSNLLFNPLNNLQIRNNYTDPRELSSTLFIPNYEKNCKAINQYQIGHLSHNYSTFDGNSKKSFFHGDEIKDRNWNYNDENMKKANFHKRKKFTDFNDNFFYNGCMDSLNNTRFCKY